MTKKVHYSIYANKEQNYMEECLCMHRFSGRILKKMVTPDALATKQ